MPRPRVELQELLETTLGSRSVYFNPPETVRMTYPAIVYERSDIDNMHADNLPYIRNYRYMLTVIDKNPDSAHVDAVSMLPSCSYDRHYVADNLHHDVFTIYF